MSRYRYEYKNGLVNIWDNNNLNEDGSPSIIQPYHPDTKSFWVDEEEANSWAENKIAELETPIVIEEINIEEIVAES